jgi:urease accessory protein
MPAHMPPASLLILADGRLPAGGHAHSGGLEAAVEAGAVTDLAGLEAFLRGRLTTAGLVAAGLAAAACTLATRAASAPSRTGTSPRPAFGVGTGDGWDALDAEADARMPSPGQRAASRAQGRALLRVARAAWPHPALDLLGLLGRAPHHPLVLGATVAGTGTREQAASLAALHAVSGPASAGVRLLSLDPIAVTGLLAGLAPVVDRVAADAAAAEVPPAAGAPLLDFYAETHRRAEVRLFAS